MIIFFRTFFNKEDKKRFKEKIFSSSFNVERKTDTKLLWFHAASVGEFISILPVIKELDKNQNLEFLITTVSLSSSKIAERELKNLVNVTLNVKANNNDICTWCIPRLLRIDPRMT